VGPPNISGTVEATNFIFDTVIDDNEYYRINLKLGQKMVTCGSSDPLLEYWDPLYISETTEAINFKYGIEIDDNVCYY